MSIRGNSFHNKNLNERNKTGQETRNGDEFQYVGLHDYNAHISKRCFIAFPLSSYAGVIEPTSGVDAEFDEAIDDVKEKKKALDQYRKKMEKDLDCSISFYHQVRQLFGCFQVVFLML